MITEKVTMELNNVEATCDFSESNSADGEVGIEVTLE